MQSSFVSQKLDRRATTIMNAVRVGQVPPTSDALAELAEITEAIADRPVKSVVVARLTVIRAVGCRTIIEVCEDATFHTFYRIFSQEGSRRSTKRMVRTASRNEGLISYQAHRMTPGLQILADRWLEQPGVESVKVRILRKRAYRQLVNATPDRLGLTKTAALPIYNHIVARH